MSGSMWWCAFAFSFIANGIENISLKSAVHPLFNVKVFSISYFLIGYFSISLVYSK